MSGAYLAVQLDALNKAPAVARAAGVKEDTVIAGLLRLWAWCFREAVEHSNALQVRGHFDLSAHGDQAAAGRAVCDALVAFGFLEPTGDTYRVKGAAHYLRVRDARRRGGKAAAGNLRHQRPTSDAPADHQPTTSGEPAGDQPEPQPGTSSAQAEHEPSTSDAQARPLHRAPSTEHRAPPTTTSSGDGFWLWAQAHRQELGAVREKPPHPSRLSAWYSHAMGEVAGDEDRLKAGFVAFCRDSYWRTKQAPWGGWLAQWERFVPPAAPMPAPAAVCASCGSLRGGAGTAAVSLCLECFDAALGEVGEDDVFGPGVLERWLARSRGEVA